MKTNLKLTTLGVLGTMALASISPALADGWQNSRNLQNQKNTMRNLGLAGAAVAALGLLGHNNTLAAVGAIGGALAGSQYEKDRQQQSQDNRWYYHRGDNGNWNRDNYSNQDNYGNRDFRR